MEEKISREEEEHINGLEDEATVYCNMCRCRDSLVEEIDKLDNIRGVVMPGTMIYDADDIRMFMTFLSMYPASSTISEVVHDIAVYYEELET